jgi:hypothetical protein
MGAASHMWRGLRNLGACVPEHYRKNLEVLRAASRPVACWGCYLGGLPTPWIVCRPQKTACGAFEWCNRGVQKCDIGDIEIPDVPGPLGS